MKAAFKLPFMSSKIENRFEAGFQLPKTGLPKSRY